MSRHHRRHCLGAWLLAAILSGLSLTPAAPSPARSSPAIRKLEWFASRDGAVPGGALDLALRVTLQPGFHLNTHTPSQDFLIPTSLEMERFPEATFADWIYPKGEAKRFSFSEDPIQVYEGTIVIRGRIRIGSDAAPGRRRTVTRLRFQACTKDRCYPPGRQEAVLEFRVVPLGHGTKPLHAELFRDERP